MKKMLLSVILVAAFAVCSSAVALGADGDPPTDPGGLFLVDIDGERVVVEFWGSEQTWQYTPPGAPGYWVGLAPHPFDFKIWYPYLVDTFDMTLDEQLEWIEDLDYAGIDDWRIGYYWDVIPLKASMFGGMTLGLPMPNSVSNFDSSVYFPPTACGMGMGGYQCIHLGRTGNECGNPDPEACPDGGSGAIINAMMGFPGPINPRYVQDGVIAKGGMGGVTNYYTLPRSEAQDHWISFPMGSPLGSAIYNDDLNGNPDDTTIGLMSPVDEVTGKQPIGAWTVSGATPELWPPNHKFHEITISAAINPAGDLPAGTLVPVTIVSVMQDEAVDSKGSGNTAPDAIVTYTDEAAVVQVRAERDGAGNGRVYHIQFTDGEGTQTFTVGVPKSQGRKHVLVDDGPLYDSTVE